METNNQSPSPTNPSPYDATTDQPEPSLVEVLAEYADAGFDADAFAAEGGMILCGSCQSLLSPDHIDIYSIRRLEGSSDPSDNVGVVAIICPVCKAKATMVLKYGPEATVDETAIWHHTNDRRASPILPPDMPPGEDTAARLPPEFSTPSAKPELPPPVEFE